MSEQTLEVVRDVRERLYRAARRIDVSEFLFGLVLAIAVACGLWVVLAAAESLFWLDLSVRRLLVAGWAIATVGVFAVMAAPPLLRLTGITRPNREERVALRVGAHFPDVSDRLVNLLQLSAGRGSHSSESLLDGAIGMLARQVQGTRFEAVEDFARPRRAALRSAVAPAALLLFAAAAPASFIDASHRLISLETTFEPPAPFALHVSPGDIEMTRGESLTISVQAQGSSLPSAATVFLQPAGVDEAEPLAMISPSVGRFEHDAGVIRQNVRYRVEADGISSPWHEVRLMERPFVRSLQLRVEPPSYTALPAQDLVMDRGDVAALRGTRVHVRTSVAGADVERVYLEFDHAEPVRMELENGTAEGTFIVTDDDAYRIIAESESGVRNADPITYRVEPLPDEAPTILLVMPGAEEALDESLQTILGGRALDDFGFSRLQLRYRLAESRYRQADTEFRSVDLPLETPRPVDQEIIHMWQLGQTDLDPVPGDVIEYFLEIWDNDAYAGPKSARSSVHRLRVPSLSERYEDLDRKQDAAQDEMQRLLEEAGEIRRDFEQIRDELRSKQDADWQDRRQVEAVQQRQEAMEQRVDELTRRMEEATREMEQNDLLSEETIEMYRELTRVVEEIKSPELMEALQQLQEAIEQLDLSRMQESMQDFQFNEEQYRQRLERSLELFKRARTMQQLEQAERMARELAQRQEELRDAAEKSTDNPDADSQQDNPSEEQPSQDADPSNAREPQESGAETPPNDEAAEEQDTPPQDSDQAPSREQVAQEQERLSDEMESLEQKLDEVRQQMNESRSSPRQQMDQLRERVRQQQLPEEMRKTGQQIRNNQMQDAGRNQQNMQQQLQELQQQLGQMRSSMSGAQLQMNMSGLRRTIRDIISLSQEQEGLQNSTIEKGAGSPALREMARTQVRIADGVGVVADSLQSLASEIPQMSREAQRHTGEALREMSRATEALADRSARQAGTHQRAGMTHLNELALMLSDLLDQLMSQQSGEGGGGMSVEEMADQLQQMSQEQQRLNQQIQQMLNDMHGDRLSSDAQERLRQMAAQQEQIRRQLRQLSRDPLAREALMNDLNRIAEQMQETVEELQRSGASRQTIERQQQILTRLLEAERSLQERKQDEQRRGRTGEDVRREGPEELQRSQEMERLRRDLIRALESDYSQDYQELIRKYFELLRNEREAIE